MTPRRARRILETDEEVSIEEYAEALSVMAKRRDNKKITNPENSHRAHQKWLQGNREQTELRREIRKYWGKSS